MSPSTRDRFLVRGDIKWVAGGEHEGLVQKKVLEEGDVTGRVLEGMVQWGGTGRRKKLMEGSEGNGMTKEGGKAKGKAEGETKGSKGNVARNKDNEVDSNETEVQADIDKFLL